MDRSYPPDWDVAPLGQFILSARNGYGGRPNGVEDGPIVLRLADVSKGYVDLTDARRVNMSEDDFQSYRIHEDDLIFVRVNGSRDLVAQCIWVDREYPDVAFNDHLIRVKTNNQINNQFLKYLFTDSFIRSRLLSFIPFAPGGQLTINQGALSALEIPIPPLAEQRKIAAILSTWDDAIATVERLIDALQRRKRGLMQRLLTGEVRFPEFAGSEWREVELGEYVRPISRTESIDEDKTYKLLGVRWYMQGAHIHDTVPGSDISTSSLSRIEANDIVYNKMWVSKAAFAVAKEEHAGSYGSTEYPQFRAKSGLDVRFLEAVFHDQRFQHDATSLCRGTTGRIRLNPTDFLKLKIKLPGIAEQAKIADVFKTANLELDKMQSYLASLQLQKKALMQRLLTGEVRVQVDEAAQPVAHTAASLDGRMEEAR